MMKYLSWAKKSAYIFELRQKRNLALLRYKCTISAISAKSSHPIQKFKSLALLCGTIAASSNSDPISSLRHVSTYSERGESKLKPLCSSASLPSQNAFSGILKSTASSCIMLTWNCPQMLSSINSFVIALTFAQNRFSTLFGGKMFESISVEIQSRGNIDRNFGYVRAISWKQRSIMLSKSKFGSTLTS